MNRATTVQKLLIAVGAVVLLGGLACVVMGFASFAGDDVDEGNSSLALFAAGGFAAVIGFGIVAFTRAAILTRNGAYSRITFEQGMGPSGGRFCSSCGRPVAPTARFCEACGHAVG
jgi:di/tricarboxylate transporter